MELLLKLDYQILNAVNSWVGQWVFLDKAVNVIANNHIFKGIPIAFVFWFLWFQPSENTAARRTRLIAVLIVSIVAIAVGRFSATALPFRPRPLQNPALDVNIPSGIDASVLGGWSAFPSDHAVLFFAFAAAIYTVNRIAGLLIFVHASIIAGIARVFMTFHYPGDVIAGAVIGLCLGFLLVGPINAVLLRISAYKLSAMHPQYFYPVLFFVTFQFASMFESLRTVLSAFGEFLTLIV